MRYDSMVSRYAIPTGIPQVDGWSTGPPGFGASHKGSYIYDSLVSINSDARLQGSIKPL